MYVQLAIWAGSVIVNRYLHEIEQDAQDAIDAEQKRLADKEWLKGLEIPGTASPGDVIPIIFGSPTVACQKIKQSNNGTLTGITFNGDSMFYQSGLFVIGNSVDYITDIMIDSSTGGGLDSIVKNVLYKSSTEQASVSGLLQSFTAAGVDEGVRWAQFPKIYFAPKQYQELGQASSDQTSKTIDLDGDGVADISESQVVNLGAGIGITTFPDGMPDSVSGPLPTEVSVQYTPTGSTTQILATGDYFWQDDEFKDVDSYTASPKWSVRIKDADTEYRDVDVSRFKGLSCVNLSEIGITGESRLDTKLFAKVERIPKTGLPDVDKWVNYSSKVVIGNTYKTLKGANPVGVALEIMLNSEWGLGLTLDDIDASAFEYAAEVMYNEGLFLSVAAKASSANAFLDSCATVGEFMVYEDRTTGKVSIRVLRAEVVADHSLDDTKISKINSISVSDPSSVPSQVEVRFTDANTREAVTYSQANDNGTQSTFTLETPYVTDSSVADTILTRAANVMTSRSARVTLTVPSSIATTMNIADVVSVQSNTHTIPVAQYRLLGLAESKQDSGMVTLTLMTDVWSRASTPYYKRSEALLTELIRQPRPSPAVYATGATYFELSLRTVLNGGVPADIPTLSFGTVIASSPSKFHTKFGIPEMESEQYNSQSVFSPFATIGVELSASDQYIPMNVIDTLPTVFGVYYIDDELVQVTGIVFRDGQRVANVNRGCHDTVPKPHVLGSTMMMLRNDGFRNWTASLFMLPPTAPVSQFKVITYMRENEAIDASEVSYTQWNPADGSRQFLPPTPTNVKVNGSWSPIIISGDVTLSWNHRQHEDDFQAKELKSFLDLNGTYGGKFYKVTFVMDGGANTFTDTTTALGYVVLEANLIAANGGVAPTSIDLTIEGYDPSNANLSWQKYEYSITYGAGTGQGWGFDWGNNWGD